MQVNAFRECPLGAENRSKIEEVKSAKAVCACAAAPNSALVGTLFYQEKPYNGSHYFILFYDGSNSLLITVGEAAASRKYVGIRCGDKIVYSAGRHSYTSGNGGAIDGGDAYTRIVGNPEIFEFKIENGEIVVENA